MVMVEECARALDAEASCIMVMATGMQAPMPRPAMRRTVARRATVGISGKRMVKMEKISTQIINGTRRPKRSEIGPISTAPAPTPTSEMVAMKVASIAVIPAYAVSISCGIEAD